MNYKITAVLILLIGLNFLLFGQNATPSSFDNTLNQEILIGKLNGNGTLDTINLTQIINGIDTVNSFVDQNGNTINYRSFKDKVILLDFWFLACPPCIVELPGLELMKKKIPSNEFDIITFANDSFDELNDKLLSKRSINLSITPEVFLITNASYPLKLLTNKKGIIIDSKNGGNTGSNSIALLFDYLQKPSFLELSKVEKGLVLKMYQPDSRYFFFLKKRAVKQLILSEGDKLTYQIQQSILSVFNKIIFIIQKKNGEVLKTNQINIGWMSQNQLNILNQLVKAQNNPIN